MSNNRSQHIDDPRAASRTLVSRRGFLFGAIGAGVVAIGAGGAVAYSQYVANKDEEIEVLSVPESSVVSSADCEQIDNSSDVVTQTGNFSLPYGTLVWSSSDSVACCLIPTEEGKPLTMVGLLDLSKGDLHTILQGAQGLADGYEIYDARANEHGVVWTEANVTDGTWRVLSAPLSSFTMGASTQVAEGSSDWEMPSIAAVGDFAVWQVLPRTDGAHKSDESALYKARFSTSSTETLLTSKGRMCTPIYALSDSVVVSPRTNTSTVHHRLTHIGVETGEVLDTLVLPQSMKPLEAGYTKHGFFFCFDSIYSYGDGIANLGTYVPVENAQQTDYSTAEWFRFARNPVAPSAWCGNWFIVKSSTAVCGVNIERMKTFVLTAASGSDDYGDYLATTGTGSSFVTYANVDYNPVNAAEEYYTSVRLWTVK